MPTILWDEGTAYDFFVSLYVLHRPGMFGVRPSWAAGVRSRLPTPQRDFLEKIHSFLPVPLNWLYLLPAEAKTVAGALHTLAQTPPAERLPSLIFTADTSIEVINTLRHIALRQTWSSAEQEVLRAAFPWRGITPRPNTISNLCEAWCDLTRAGEQYLRALETYAGVFFQEEEKRVIPVIHHALRQAQRMASSLPPEDLLARLSHGVHFQQIDSLCEIILVPSYWTNPLVFYNHLNEDRLLVLFSYRMEAQSGGPEAILTEELAARMKAIADPTRLRILHYLTQAPLSPSELARRLHLRPPTVIHHLNELRLVGLVEITLHPDGERGYSLRREALNETLSHLSDFLRS